MNPYCLFLSTITSIVHKLVVMNVYNLILIKWSLSIASVKHCYIVLYPELSNPSFEQCHSFEGLNGYAYVCTSNRINKMTKKGE